MAAALGAMPYPVFLFELATRLFDSATLATAAYSLPVTIFGGIWISRKLCQDLTKEPEASRSEEAGSQQIIP